MRPSDEALEALFPGFDKDERFTPLLWELLRARKAETRFREVLERLSDQHAASCRCSICAVLEECT